MGKSMYLRALLGLGLLTAVWSSCKNRGDSSVKTIDTPAAAGLNVHFIEGGNAFRYLCDPSAREALKSFSAIKASAKCKAAGSLSEGDFDQRLSKAYLESSGTRAGGDNAESQLNTFEVTLKRNIMKCLKTPDPCNPIPQTNATQTVVAKQMQAWLTGLMDKVFDDANGAHPSFAVASAGSRDLLEVGGEVIRGGATLTMLALSRVDLLPNSDQQIALPITTPQEVNYVEYWLNEECREASLSITWVESASAGVLAGPGSLALISPNAIILHRSSDPTSDFSTALTSISLLVHGKDVKSSKSCSVSVAGRKNIQNAESGIVLASATAAAVLPPFKIGVNINNVNTSFGPAVNVISVAPGDLADKAGLKAMDLITAVNGFATQNTDAYFEAINTVRQSGAPALILNVVRGNFRLSVSIPLDNNGNGGDGNTPVPSEFKLGVTFQLVAVAGQRGLNISSVIPGGNAAKQGMLVNDIIISVNGQGFQTQDDYFRLVDAALRAGGNSITMVALRGQQNTRTTFVFPISGGGNPGGGNPGGGNPGGGNPGGGNPGGGNPGGGNPGGGNPGGGNPGGGGNTDPKLCAGGRSRDQVMQEFMANPSHRAWHHLWHGIRNAWDSMSSGEQNQIGSVLGAAWMRRPRDGNVGEEFFQMHHLMIRMVTAHLKKNGCQMYTQWGSPPMDNDFQFRVFDRSVPQGGGQSRMQQWHNSAMNTANLRTMSLGAYGDFLESGLHNSMHMRHADPSMADPAFNVLPQFFNLPSSPNHPLNRPAQNYLGTPYSSHVNPYFWGLHGYIEKQMMLWLNTNGFRGIRGEDGCNDNNCYTWKRQWAGAIPAAANGLGLADAGDHSEHTVSMETIRQLSPSVQRLILMHANMFPGEVKELPNK